MRNKFLINVNSFHNITNNISNNITKNNHKNIRLSKENILRTLYKLKLNIIGAARLTSDIGMLFFHYSITMESTQLQFLFRHGCKGNKIDVLHSAYVLRISGSYQLTVVKRRWRFVDYKSKELEIDFYTRFSCFCLIEQNHSYQLEIISFYSLPLFGLYLVL